jgi:hypothetical protein
LAGRTNNPAKRLEALRRYTDLRPEDDAAQLELILARLGQMQTVDARLQRLERILGSEAAKQLSQPLRSRLASEAAAAARELEGETSSRASGHLRTALDLDATNEQASLMLYQLLSAREAGQLKLGYAAVHLTKASPLDWSVRQKLAEHLANQAAYERAAQQFALADRFSGQRLPESAYRQWIRCLGASAQTQRALQLLDRLGRTAGQDSEATAEGASSETGDGSGEAAGGDQSAGSDTPSAGGEQPATKQKPLPLSMALVRLALLNRPEQTNRVEAAFEGIWDRLMQVADGGRDEARLELAWVAAVFNRKTETIAPWLEQAPADDRRVRLAKGWLAVHADNQQAAETQLEPIADRDPLARFGLARVQGLDQPGKARRVKQVVTSAPQSLGALMAARWLLDHDQPVPRTGAGNGLVQAMKGMPSRLWAMDDLSRWIDVMWRIDSAQFNYLEPIRARLTVRNSTQLPLSIGAGKTVRPEAMVLIAPFRAGRSMGTMPPVVVDVGRQLRLEAGETLSVPVRLDRGPFGQLVSRQPFRSYVFNVTAKLNPQVTQRGAVVTGPLGGSDTARSLVTQTLPASAANVKDWLEQLETEEAQQQLVSIARLASVQPPEAGGGNSQGGNQSNADQAAGNGVMPGQVDRELAQRVVETLTEQFGQFNAVRQAWTVLMIPASEAAGRRFEALLQQARASEKPLVRMSYLASQVRSADAPALLQASREGSGEVQRFAKAVRAGLKAQAEAEKRRQQQSDN